jgi:hypothetical protein
MIYNTQNDHQNLAGFMIGKVKKENTGFISIKLVKREITVYGREINLNKIST